MRLQRYAAFTIQRCYTMLRARQRVRQRCTEKLTRASERQQAAMRITRWTKECYQRNIVLPRIHAVRTHAAEVIQRAARVRAAFRAVKVRRHVLSHQAQEKRKDIAIITLQRWFRRCVQRRNSAAYKIQNAIAHKLQSLRLKREALRASASLRGLFARELLRRETVARSHLVKDANEAWQLIVPPYLSIMKKSLSTSSSPAATLHGEAPEEEEAVGRKVLHMEAVRWWADVIRQEATERIQHLRRIFLTFSDTEKKFRKRIEAEQLRVHRDVRVRTIMISRHNTWNLVKGFMATEKLERSLLEQSYDREVRGLTKELLALHDAIDKEEEAARRTRALAVRKIAATSSTSHRVPAFARNTDMLLAIAAEQKEALRAAAKPPPPKDILDLSLRALTDDDCIVVVHRALMLSNEIRTIRLEGNNLTDVAIVAVAHDIGCSQGCVTSLNISHNPRVSDVGGSAILNTVRCTPSLTSVDLSGTAVTLNKRRVIQAVLDLRHDVLAEPNLSHPVSVTKRNSYQRRASTSMS